MDGQPSLREILLDPRGEEFLPSAHAHSWKTRIESLHAHLRDLGIHHRLRTPSALWAALKGTPLPFAATWDALLGSHSVADLVGNMRGHRIDSGPSFASWNVRWMVDPHSAQGIAKDGHGFPWLNHGQVEPHVLNAPHGLRGHRWRTAHKDGPGHPPWRLHPSGALQSQ